VNHDLLEFVSIEELEKSGGHKLFELNKKYDISFRDGFNKSVTERFFLIEELVDKFSLENIFHIENDILLFFQIENLIGVFESEYDFASVFDNDNRCIPSFVYFKNLDSVKKLCKFINLSNQTNDMRLLSDYRYVVKNCPNLPIIPESFEYPLVSKTGLTTRNPRAYSNNFKLFDSIFDAACIGQYLGGVDSRNTSGNTIGFINESSILNPSFFKYRFINDTEGRKIPYIEHKGEYIKINNLHIHSKELKKHM